MSEDLIRRSDAIKHCEVWRDRAKEYKDRDGWWMADNLLGLIRDIPTIKPKRGEWIPCSERLPKEDGFYLVTITDGEQIAVCRMSFVESEWKGNWFDDEVIAWMPIPKPYCGADMRGKDDETD